MIHLTSCGVFLIWMLFLPGKIAYAQAVSSLSLLNKASYHQESKAASLPT
jgi:hypothetical protein